MSLWAPNALRVKLKAPAGMGAVGDRHHQAIIGLGGHLQLRWQRASVDHKGVVAHHLQRVGQARKQAACMVPNRAGFAVHGNGCVDDPGTAVPCQALVTETDSEERNVCEVLEDIGTHTEVCGSLRTPGPRGEDDVGGREGANAGEVDAIVAHHYDLGPGAAEVVGEVPGEGVVVVDQQDAMHKRAHGHGSRVGRFSLVAWPKRGYRAPAPTEAREGPTEVTMSDIAELKKQLRARLAALRGHL